MKALNLFNITRIQDAKIIDLLLCFECNKTIEKRHEFKSLKLFVDKMVEYGLNIQDLEGFYLNYQIPQISKEFDLIKISENYVLNIELKSKYVEVHQIKKQLIQNQYYLSVCQKNIIQYSIITDDFKCYKVEKEELVNADPNEIVNTLKKLNTIYEINIDEMFCPKKFLISPLNDFGKFMEKQYYLTSQQEKIKSDILKEIQDENNNFFKLSGDAGTGKTLLLYDIAVELANHYKIIIFHCGKLPKENHLNKIHSNIKIKEIETINYYLNNNFESNKFDFIFIDESQRIYPDQFNDIVNYVNTNKKKCVLSIDPKKTLSNFENRNNINDKIKEFKNLVIHNLSNKIRISGEIYSFTRLLFDLNEKPKMKKNYSNIDILYANNETEAKQIIHYYENTKNYIFINYTASFYVSSSISDYSTEYHTHNVIGQEFDNVMMLINEDFYYENNKLCAKPHPNPDYLYVKLLYQGATRAREKLCLVVKNNLDFYEKILQTLRSITNIEGK